MLDKVYNSKLHVGCLYKINGLTLRAKKANEESLNKCEGCFLDNPYTCPNVKCSNKKENNVVYCNINNIIFVKP